MRCKETEELFRDPLAFVLLTLIAYRARRSDEFSTDGLSTGEALIGDYKNMGLTKQEYRTRKKKLEKWGFVTLKTTNRGTVATIVGTRIYDINAIAENTLTNTQPTLSQHSANTQLTPNKKVKKGKKVNKYSLCFEIFWKQYVRGESKGPAYEQWKKIDPELHTHIVRAVAQQKINGCLKDPKFAPYAERWLKNTRWTDAPIKQAEPEQHKCFRCNGSAKYHIDGEKEWWCSSKCRDKYYQEKVLIN